MGTNELLPYYGVFTDISSAPTINYNVFDNEEWVQSVDWYFAQDLNNSSCPNFWLEPYLREFTMLIINECLHSGKSRVLDFGGGMGNTYLPVSTQISAKLNYEYHIVDTPRNCLHGRKVFQNDTRIQFIEALPTDGTKFETPSASYDIIFTSSTLQYMHNWQEVLKKLIGFNPKYFFLTRLSSGEMPTFTTRQSLVMGYGPHKDKYIGDIYHTFINRSELIRFFQERGFEVVYDVFYSDYSENLKALPLPYRNACLRTMVFVNSSL